MLAQLDKLAELAHEPDMVIQVLPYTASESQGEGGPILVHDFDGTHSVAYTECSGGGRIIGLSHRPYLCVAAFNSCHHTG
jgi:hypothetical protein